MSLALRIRRRLWVALGGDRGVVARHGREPPIGPRCEAMPAGCTTCSCCEDASTASLKSATAPALSAASPTRDMVVGRPAASTAPRAAAPEAL